MHDLMNELKNTPQEGVIENVKPTKNRLKQLAKTGGAKGLWWNAFWPCLALACVIGPALPIFGGCAFVNKVPEVEPTPTPVPDIPIHPDVYKPAPITDDTTIKHLTDGDPKDSGGKNLIPDFYQLVGADGGDKLTLQAYRIPLTAAGKEGVPYIVPLDKPVRVKLGGILCPLRDERGWGEARSVTQNWLGGRRLQVDEDKKYPIGIDGRNIVQIRIKSEVKTKAADGTVTKTEEERPFNQLLVRAGYAFVDLITPTSFDYKTWIVDEEYARGVREEPAPWQLKNVAAGQPTPKPAPGTPVGLWAQGIYPYPDFRPGATHGPKTIVIGADKSAVKVITKEITVSAGAKTISGTTSRMAMTKTSRTGTTESGKVWINTDSKENVYHYPNSRFYRKTKAGKLMSESAAKAAGYRPAKKGQ